MCAENFDLIALTETWLDSTNKNFFPEFEMAGYQMLLKDRKGRKGGGVALYVKNSLKCTINSFIKINADSESLWVEEKNCGSYLPAT